MFKAIVLNSDEALHSVVANKGKFFAVLTKTVQSQGFSRKAVTLVEIEEVAKVDADAKKT